MSKTKWLHGLVAALAMLAYVAPAATQNFPSKLVRIAATEAGGGGDIVMRLLTPELNKLWGQPVVVENRNSILSNEFVHKSPPDGHILLINSSSLWLWPALTGKTPWDPLKDFTPIIQAVRQPSVLVVPASLPVNNMKELITYAKARPGELNYSTGVIGATTHFAAELFTEMADVKVVPVFYKGTSAAFTALLGGQVQIMFPNAASVIGSIKSGKVKALGVTTARPSPLVPGVPSISDAGLPGYDAETILGIFGPGGMRPAVVSRINNDINTLLNRPDIKDRLFDIGLQVVGGPSQVLLDSVKMEMSKWGKLIKDKGIHVE